MAIASYTGNMSQETCLVASGIHYDTLNNNYRHAKGRRLVSIHVYNVIQKKCTSDYVGKEKENAHVL